MAITKNTDYYTEGLGRLLQQFKNKPRIAALLEAWLTECQEVEDAMWDIFSRRLFQDANIPTAMLDIYGIIVGQERNGQSDAAYLIYITARIRTNRSGGQASDLQAITALLIPSATTISVLDYGPASVVVMVDVAVTDVDPYLVMTQFLELAVAAGVEISFIWTPEAPSNTFIWGDIHSTDAENPGVNQSPGDINSANPNGGLMGAVI